MYKLYIEKDVTTKELFYKVINDLGIKDSLIYNEYGKPYFENSNLFFNMSSSGCYTVLAISNKEVGVDIERITMNDSVIDSICTDEEKKIIKNADDFTIMWTKKESYVKMTGKGLTENLTTVDTLSNAFYQQILVDDGYVISVCTALENERAQVKDLSEYL